MKANILMIALSALILSACDSQEPAKNTAKPEAAKTEEVAAPVVKATEPVASLAPVEEAAPVVAEAKTEMTGEQVYAKSCISCHGSGVAGAPKLGDVAAWESRVAKGMDALYNSAMKGVPGTAMMPKGTCVACSDVELKAAVDYMVSKVK